jgi:hypothetical protein
MTFITAFAAFFCMMILFDGGGVYDPDPSADERYKMYQRQKRKEFFAKLTQRFAIK